MKQCHTWKSGEDFLNSKRTIGIKAQKIQKQR